VNCAGCFFHALPMLIELARRLEADPVSVVALSTCYEDLEYNTKENTRALVANGTIVGEVKRALEPLGKTRFDLPPTIAVGFDEVRAVADVDDLEKHLDDQAERMVARIEAHGGRPLPPGSRDAVRRTLSAKHTYATTFDGNGLLGTPSWLIFDSKKDLQYTKFGHVAIEELEATVRDLLSGESRGEGE